MTRMRWAFRCCAVLLALLWLTRTGCGHKQYRRAPDPGQQQAGRTADAGEDGARATSSPWPNHGGPEGDPCEGMAISLRQLARNLGQPGSDTLHGATRIHGFVVSRDVRGEDVILVTRHEPGRPPLRLDDLVVACRNISSGGTRPGCSIDPRADVLKALTAVGHQMANCRHESELDDLLAQWKQLATRPQDVSVLGVDPDTHFARTMVHADYCLKSVCNGSEKIPGLPSLVDLLLEQAKSHLTDEGEQAIPTTLCNRFWFNAGEILFVRDGGTVLLKRCQVVLLTEEEAVTPSGRLRGTGKPGDCARRFAEDFTRQYGKVAKDKPIYRELENLYRFTALADLMLDRSLSPGGRAVVDNLVGRVRLRRLDHQRTVPGAYGLAKLRGRLAAPNQSRQYWLYLPSCGGVAIAVKIGPHNLQPDSSGGVLACQKQLIAARPSANAVCWRFRVPTGLNVLLENEQPRYSALTPALGNVQISPGNPATG